MMEEKLMDALEAQAQEPVSTEEAAPEVIELEIDEDDILYYITDQDDNEIGFAIMEDGREAEYFYETDEEYEIAEVLEDVDADKEEGEDLLIEMEIDDDDILYYITDQDDNEIGFAIMEDGREVEYYYVEDEEAGGTTTGDAAADAPAAAGNVQHATDAAAPARGDGEVGAFFTPEEVAGLKDDMVGILKDGASLARELKSTYDEFSDVIDFLPIKKRRR